jgi:chemotaxis protein CheD
VAVCLWSPSDRVAALAHFVEPSTRDPARATPRFGNVAVPELVRMVRESGPCRGLEAQLFGASEENFDDPRARANAEMALRVLASRSVPVVSRDLGGGKGRKIVFDGRSGQVAVLKVHRLRQEDWNP